MMQASAALASKVNLHFETFWRRTNAGGRLVGNSLSQMRNTFQHISFGLNIKTLKLNIEFFTNRSALILHYS